MEWQRRAEAICDVEFVGLSGGWRGAGPQIQVTPTNMSSSFDLGANSSQDEETKTVLLISQALLQHIARPDCVRPKTPTHTLHASSPLTQQLSTMDLDPVLSHPHSCSHSQIPLYAQLCTWLGVWGHLTDLFGCRNSTDTLIYMIPPPATHICTHIETDIHACAETKHPPPHKIIYTFL